MAEKVSVHREVPHITEAKLLKNIHENELQFNSLYAKKLDVSTIKINLYIEFIIKKTVISKKILFIIRIYKFNTVRSQ